MPDVPQPTACASCRADLSNVAYVVDKKGRGLCKPCVAKLKAKQKAKAEADARAKAAGDGDVMDILLADSAASTKTPCPECQAYIEPDSVVCVHCGYNTASGKQMKTRVTAAPKDKDPSKAGAAAVQIANTVWWVPSLIGGGIGTAIGGLLWYFIGTTFNVEVSYVAWVVGLLAGGGCALGARGNANLMTGGFAAVLAVLGIGLAKWAFVEDIYGDMVNSPANDQYAIEIIAGDLMEQAGTSTMAVPTIGRRGRIGGAAIQRNKLSQADAEQQATQIWRNDFTSEERQEMITEIRDWQQEIRLDSATIKEEIFTDMLGLFDIIFLLVAVVTALGVGSGGQFSLGDD